MTRDAVIVGGGPAALAGAAACAEAGLAIAIVDPDPEGTWPQTYGFWIDELVGCGLDSDHVLGHRWDDVTVVGRREHVLSRHYAVFDNAALAAALRERASTAEIVVGRVVGANHDRWGSTAVLSDGRFLDARVLVDATGHEPVLVHRAERPARAYQSAFGIVARITGPTPSPCTLMDWTGGPGTEPDPTFLYALELGDGWWLLEETSLARRLPLAVAVLEDRLRRRLVDRGIEVREVRREERVSIPMGLAVPALDQRAVGLGGAASLVHPASGYSVAASLRAAPRLAAALALAIERRATPQGAADAGWAAVWPAGRRRARAFEEFGLEALLRLDLGDLRSFFDAFFDLPDHLWFPYLTGTASSAEVMATMRELFADVPAGVRTKLAATNPTPLLRAVAWS